MIEVQNSFQGYDANWNMVCKSDTVRLSDKCHARLTREAREHFEGFGIDFSQYGAPVVELIDEVIASVEWTHLTSGKAITLLEVWFDEKTGAIHQCGQNYGGLVS